MVVSGVPMDSLTMSTVHPMVFSALAISVVSRLTNAPVIVDGPSARAARINARLVIDLEPGTATVAFTGADARGAGQNS